MSNTGESPTDPETAIEQVNPLITNNILLNPTKSTGWNLNQPTRNIRLKRDKQGNIWGQVVIITDPSQANLAPASTFGLPGGDASTAGYLMGAQSYGMAFNGTQWDRIRNSQNLGFGTDATTSNFSKAFTIYNAKSMVFTVNVTGFSGTNWTPNISYQDGNGTQYSVWTGATETGNTNQSIFVGPNGAQTYIGTTLATISNAPSFIPRIITVNITKTAVATINAAWSVDISN